MDTRVSDLKARLGSAILDGHAELLAASAISPETAAARGYRSVTKGRELLDLGFTNAQARVPGLLISLYNPRGDPAGYQYRPDEPRVVGGKQVKYESPQGQRNVLDVPLVVRQELSKGKQAIFITEGARKADALASMGVPVISIAGVYGWRGTNKENGRTALSDWEDISIKGSVFVLAFDSDILTTLGVHQALGRLKRFLEGRGADKVRILVLPPPLDGKTGVDDFIAASDATVEDLARLVVDGLPTPPSSETAPETAPEAATEPPGPPPEGSVLLDAVASFYRRFVVLTPEQGDALAVWTAHTHAIDGAETTAYINVTSAERESGKTRTGEVALVLVASPLAAQSISPSALARSVDTGMTLLLDEVDTIFDRGGRAASETTEMLRGVLDSGWRRGGAFVRMVGQGANMTPQAFQTFGAKMLIGIGELPSTLGSRSVRIELRRRRRDTETIEPFRIRKTTPEGHALRDQLAAWAVAHLDALRAAEPSVPEELGDRMMDSWEPLLAIADAVGGSWPDRVRRAAVALCAEPAEDAESLGMRLLRNLRGVFGDAERHTTAELVMALKGIEGAPWSDMGRAGQDRREFNANTLARLLRPYGIGSQQFKADGTKLRGYTRVSFEDAWARYCPVLPSNALDPVSRYFPDAEALELIPATPPENTDLVAPAAHDDHVSTGVPAEGAQQAEEVVVWRG